MKQTEVTRERAAELTAQLTPEEKLGLLTTHQHAVERLGLEEFYIGTEVARGFVGRAESDFSTVFPQPVGLAATFDRDLLYQLGEIATVMCFGLLLSTPLVRDLRRRFDGSVLVAATDGLLQLVFFVCGVSYLVISAYNPFIYFNF